MTEVTQCPECGAELGAGTPKGLCSRCALKGALELSAESEGELELPRRFGDYVLLEEIARGGMGVVYRGRQLSLDRVVAVKMILAGPFASREFIQRFRAEAQAAASLQHPHIVAIHEVGEYEGQHFFTMDYIEGQSLAECVRERPLPARQAARYLKAIAEAVHHAHEHGILHRDLKPSNVLIDAFDQPRITDFGLAKRLNDESDLTISGKALGSPAYMPPEQALGERKRIGPQSDVYAVGALLYHLLTGRAPFVAETMEATLMQVVHNEPASPRALNPNVPRDLDTICLKCLDKERSRRYVTARELAEDLERFLSGEPIEGRPVSTTGRFVRWSRRNPVVAGLAALALILFSAGFSGVLWQWWRAEELARSESTQRERADSLIRNLEILRAEEFFAVDNTSAALAYLASVLRRDPGNRVATSRLISALTARNIPVLAARPMNHAGSVAMAVFSPDGQKMATASADKTARVWNCLDGKPLLQPLLHEDLVCWVLFSPDGLLLVTGCENGTVRVWDVVTGNLLATLRAHTERVASAQFSPDSQLLATASSDGTARVWRARTGDPVTEPLRHGDDVNLARFSPDGEWLVTVADDGSAQIWESRTGKVLIPPLRHERQVAWACFSPDGRKIVTACFDGTARVWDTRTGQPILPPMRHDAQIFCAEFSPDGTLLVTASWDNTARVWDAGTGKAVA
ncbi:MAG TPA: serine/threonine-protein kinase, partial [Verrucomicrobiae bacterium]|nr:serine/threonine-protein kinase [Verrucomicrobiae bacterium]